MKNKLNASIANKRASRTRSSKSTRSADRNVDRQASILRSFRELPDEAGVEVGIVAALKGVSVPTAWRWARDGLLPQPERIGRVTRWRVGDLRSHRFNESA